jgi:hypothetical protein
MRSYSTSVGTWHRGFELAYSDVRRDRIERREHRDEGRHVDELHAAHEHLLALVARVMQNATV